MFGYTFFEIFIALIIPIIYLSPMWIALYRNIHERHIIVSAMLTVLAVVLPYPFWAIPLLVSVMPKSVIGKLWPLDK